MGIYKDVSLRAEMCCECEWHHTIGSRPRGNQNTKGEICFLRGPLPPSLSLFHFVFACLCSLSPLYSLPAITVMMFCLQDQSQRNQTLWTEISETVSQNKSLHIKLFYFAIVLRRLTQLQGKKWQLMLKYIIILKYHHCKMVGNIQTDRRMEIYRLVGR